MAKLIESKNIIDLTEFAAKPESPVKVEDFYPGLLPWCKPASGEGIYGLPVDCNPLVFWFNETMLADAGVTNPVELHEAGTWNRDALRRAADQDQGHRQARPGGRRRVGVLVVLDDHLRRQDVRREQQGRSSTSIRSRWRP